MTGKKVGTSITHAAALLPFLAFFAPSSQRSPLLEIQHLGGYICYISVTLTYYVLPTIIVGGRVFWEFRCKRQTEQAGTYVGKAQHIDLLGVNVAQTRSNPSAWHTYNSIPRSEITHGFHVPTIKYPSEWGLLNEVFCKPGAYVYTAMVVWFLYKGVDRELRFLLPWPPSP